MNIRIEFTNVKGIEATVLAEALKILGNLNVNAESTEVLDEHTQEEKVSKEKNVKENLKANHTMDELRSLAIAKSNDGKSDGVKAIITKFGLKRVTEANDAQIDLMFKEMEKL